MALTHKLAQYANEFSYRSLPKHVQHESCRAFVNWMGCVLGGSQDPAVKIAVQTAFQSGGHPQSHIIGFPDQIDRAQAAFLNCLSSSILAFDDTHLMSVTHPTGPVAAALLAFSETLHLSGERFLEALALGIEIQCRLSKMLVTPPSGFSLGFFITGITAPIATAAALGKILHFDEHRMRQAMGLAATQAAGLRVTHGSMAAAFVPAQAARSAVLAALFVEQGFTCSEHALEGAKGLVEVLAPGADMGLAIKDLHIDYEMMANAYKPYPCGIVIHPALDACLEAVKKIPSTAKFSSVKLTVHPLALTLTGLRDPIDAMQAQISLFHWTAAALVRGQAGLAEAMPASVDDPEIMRLRHQIEAVADPDLGRDAARVVIGLDEGGEIEVFIPHARGSLDRPLTDAELDAKFLSQAQLIMTRDQAHSLLHWCWQIGSVENVGQSFSHKLASCYSSIVSKS
ncbi:MAG: MmgE/PrpD family protein [Methylocystaceae bacterium]|nr:MmgE/PrpD family protein [Methylocystaceae bacterium]